MGKLKMTILTQEEVKKIRAESIKILADVGVKVSHEEAKIMLRDAGDLPPENESSFMLDWKLRKGALDGQKVLHARANYQQAS